MLLYSFSAVHHLGLASLQRGGGPAAGCAWLPSHHLHRPGPPALPYLLHPLVHGTEATPPCMASRAEWTHWDSKATWAPEAAPCVGPASPLACNTGMGPKPPRRAPHLLNHASGAASHPPAAAACARFVEWGGAWWRQALTIDEGPRSKVAASVSAFKATLCVAPWQLPSGARAGGLSTCGLFLLPAILFDLKAETF